MNLKPSDILALSKAGYTSQQIALIASAAEKESQQEQPKPNPQPAQQEQPKPDPQPAQQEQPKPDPQPAQQEQPKPDPKLDGIMAELQKLNQNIYQANIRNSNMPEQQSPDDIIAEIIRPTNNNQGG